MLLCAILASSGIRSDETSNMDGEHAFVTYMCRLVSYVVSVRERDESKDEHESDVGQTDDQRDPHEDLIFQHAGMWSRIYGMSDSSRS